GLGVQIHHAAARRQQAAVLVRDHDPAAGGEDDATQLRELADRRRFAGAESGFALDLEDHRDLHPAAPLDLLVAVEEAQLQPPREHPPDRGLAGAHQADEIEVGGALHDRIVETKTAGRSRPSYREESERDWAVSEW